MIDDGMRELAKALAKAQVVPVLGAGVSAATARLPGWRGLIEEGVQHLRAAGTAETELREISELLDQEKLIEAAHRLRQQLDTRQDGFRRWLEKVFWQPRSTVDRRLLDAIAGLKCPLIATTNYDPLLTLHYKGNPRWVSWRDRDLMRSALLDGGCVLHLHGVFTDPDSVIFGSADYTRLGSDPAYVTLQRSLWLHRRLLFVGCSIHGIEDQDFSSLTTWATETFGAASPPHYLLLRAPEIREEDRARCEARGIRVVSYGDRREDLAGWLRALGRRASRVPAPAPSPNNSTEQRTNLQHDISSFVGRRAEVRDLQAAVRSGRLITLTGPGGCGKTRLAREVGRALLDSDEFDGEVWYVEFVATLEPERAAQQLATSLGLQVRREEPPEETVQTWIGPRRVILILNNCEQIAAACRDLARLLLQRCPRLTILATSQEPLGMQGEANRRVAALATPGSVNDPASWLARPAANAADLAGYDAVALFTTRAAEQHAGFQLDDRNAPLVLRICQRVAGIPLALELAAGQLGVRTLAEIEAGLDEDIAAAVPEADRSERHSTMWAAMNWSYGRLSPEEQSLFRRLSVFVGGWTRPAAEAVRPSAFPRRETAPVLDGLVRKSVVEREDRDGYSRYSLLEPLRAFGLHQLEAAGEVEDARDAHLRFYATWASEAEPDLYGENQDVRLRQFEAEHPNCRSALEWSSRDQERLRHGLQLAGRLARFWEMRGYLREGQERLAGLLQIAAEPGPELARGALGAGRMEMRVGDYQKAQAYLERALCLSREHGDDALTAACLGSLGLTKWYAADFEEARRLLLECVQTQESRGDRWGATVARFNLSVTYLDLGELKTGQELFDRADAEIQSLGDRYAATVGLLVRSRFANRAENYTAAAELALRGLRASHAQGIRWALPLGLEMLASALAHGEHGEHAGLCLGASRALRGRIGSPLPPVFLPEHQATVTRLRAAMGQDALDAAQDRGEQMTPEAILLELTGEPFGGSS